MAHEEKPKVVGDDREERGLRTALEGTLHVVLISAEKLRDADVFGVSDPYAVISVYQIEPFRANGNHTEESNGKLQTMGRPALSWRSITISNTLDPEWSQSFRGSIGSGQEKLQLCSQTRQGGVLQIQLFDEDVGNKDGHLGDSSPIYTNALHVVSVPPGPQEAVFELPVIHNYIQKGTLYLRAWIEANEKTEEEKLIAGEIDMEEIVGATLHLGAVRAVGLRRADMFSDSDPYVKMSVLGGVDLDCVTTWQSYECDSTRNPHWDDEGTFSFSKLHIEQATPDGGQVLVKVMDKDKGADDDELGALTAAIRVKELHFGKSGPKEPTEHAVFYNGEQEGVLYLDLWVEPDAKLARLADFATRKFKEVCAAAESPLRPKWTVAQYTQTIAHLEKVIAFISIAAKDWRIRPLMECSDEELSIGLSMVDMLSKARESKIKQEKTEESMRIVREEKKRWVQEGWKDRVGKTWGQSCLTDHQKWYYNEVHATHGKLRRGEANASGIFLKEQLFDTESTRAHLGGLKIRLKEAMLIGTYIQFAQNLVELDLGSNYICEKGIVPLADNLKSHPSLRMLNLRRNQIKEQGCVVLCNALTENKMLHLCDLSENRIGKGALVPLCTMLLRNSGLRELYLHGNDELVRCARCVEKLEHAKKMRILMKSNSPDPADLRFELFL